MSDHYGFPQNVMRYSALRYLQKRVTASAATLPRSFATLSEWEGYRGELLRFLRERLPVWDLCGERYGHTVMSTPLGSDLVLESVDVHFEDGFFIPVHLYRRADYSAPAAAVLICPGYGQQKNDKDVADMAIALAKSSFAAVTMEYDGTGERADRPDIATDINNVCALASMLGTTNVALRVMSNLAVLQYLKTRSDVDSARIGITGLCQGSLITLYTAAVCSEFGAVAPLCGATTYEAISSEYCNRQGGWSGISMYVFDILRRADLQHVAAMIAPRPLLVQNNVGDIHWPASGFGKVKELCEAVYELYGRPEKCVFRYENGSHLFAEPFVTSIVQWMSRHLGGIV